MRRWAKEECAGWLVRGSSCVEGRNGQLELRHHSLHRLSPRKLGVLTVMHNYWLKRADGTTAAERFFGGNTSGLPVSSQERVVSRPERLLRYFDGGGSCDH